MASCYVVEETPPKLPKNREGENQQSGEGRHQYLVLLYHQESHLVATSSNKTYDDAPLALGPLLPRIPGETFNVPPSGSKADGLPLAIAGRQTNEAHSRENYRLGTIAPSSLIPSALIQFSCVSSHDLLAKLTSFGGLSIDGPAAKINCRAAKAEVLNLSLDILQARYGLLVNTNNKQQR